MESHAQFESIVHEHQQMVFRTLTRLTGKEQVEDLAQEVFLRLYRALQSFRGDSTLSTYIYRITVNVAQDEWKRRRRERDHIASPTSAEDDEVHWIETLSGNEPTAEDQLAQKELWQLVNEELLQLSDAERAVLVLYHQEECSYEHIALTLKLPIGTVRTHLHRGRERLGTLVRQRMKTQPASTKIASVKKGATA